LNKAHKIKKPQGLLNKDHIFFYWANELFTKSLCNRQIGSDYIEEK